MEFEKLEQVRQLLSRAILIKYAIELDLETGSRSDLFEKFAENRIIDKYDVETESFALRFFAIGRKKNLDSMGKIQVRLKIY